MCEIDLGDPCEVWTQTRPVARKAHQCASCDGVIAPGQRYYRTFTIFEGDASTSKHCAACERDMQAFAEVHDGQIPHPTGLVDALVECINEEPYDSRRWQAMLSRVRARATSSERRASADGEASA